MIIIRIFVLIYLTMKNERQKEDLRNIRIQPSPNSSKYLLPGTHQKNVQMVEDLERSIFAYLQISDYQKNYIPVDGSQDLYTVFVKCTQKNKQQKTFYLGHGFGGTSMMFFPLLKKLLQKGNVLFWDIRGMGLNTKNVQYQQRTPEEIQQFYLDGVTKIIEFYQHQHIIMLCHSLSAYIVFMHQLKIGDPRVKKLILLSPIGITTKEEDYKNTIGSCSDIFNWVISQLGWKFHLSYKSPLRTICSCCKNYILQKSLSSLQCSIQQKQLTKDIVNTLIRLPDGSEDIFFNYFLPRVLPIFPIEPIFTPRINIKVIVFFGGEQDWADRTGVNKLVLKYPDCISVHQLHGRGHQIPFSLQGMSQVYQIIDQIN